MACPFQDMAICSRENSPSHNRGQADEEVTYGSYLKVSDLLKCQMPLSDVHDEHLFIVVHQVYELWFKQIIHEIESIRRIFTDTKIDDRSMLVVVSRVDRVGKIVKILVDQMMVLETMTPLDFMEFRGKLASSSGFQSMQFRLLENKLGVKKENRIKYNNEDYKKIFKEVEQSGTYHELILKSELEPSLFDLVETWLERTPGLEQNGFNFWEKFQAAFSCWVKDCQMDLEAELDIEARKQMQLELKKLQDTFDVIFNKEKYEILRYRGDRRLTWGALQGALLIFFYREEVLFHQPFQFLSGLMDIDSLLTKWRYNHVMLVQRQLGSKVGTGGTSGYQYLRSTVSDRYKVFLDLFNLSTYLIPRKYVPKLDLAARQQFDSFTASQCSDVNMCEDIGHTVEATN